MLIVRILVVLFLFMANTHAIQAASNPKKKILFIHHSTGGNLIKEGNVRKEIKKLNPHVEFWDYSYNLSPLLPMFLANHTHLKGLSDYQGKITGKDYAIVLSNNSPKEYADIFSRNPNDSTFKAILSYDMIVFKNCFPTTRIASDKQLAEDIQYYTTIRNSLMKYPNKQFILMTPPPSRRETTNAANAKRAMKLATFLTSQGFQKKASNIHVFDYFSKLSDSDGMLKKEYERLLPWDSHPNRKANLSISPIFAAYVVKYLN